MKSKFLFLLLLIIISVTFIFANEKTDSSPILKLSVDWFQYNRRIATQLQEYNIRNILRGDLIIQLEKDKRYQIVSQGEYNLTGNITDFFIYDYSFDRNNIVINKRSGLVFDLEIVNVKTSLTVYKVPNLFVEYIFSTEDNPNRQGITEQEAMRNLIDKTIKEIETSLDDFYKTIFLKKETEKKIELSEAQRGLLGQLEQQLQQKQEAERLARLKEEDELEEDLIIMPDPFNINFEVLLAHERIMVTSGNVDMSGESKKTTDKFQTEQKVNFSYPFKSDAFGVLEGNLITKTKSYEKKKAELDRIYLLYRHNDIRVSAGNIFANITRPLFSNSLEGMMLEWQNIINERNNFVFVAGRDRAGKNNQYFSKNNVAFGWTYNLKTGYTLTAGFSYLRDNESGIDYDTEVLSPVQNYVAGISGNFVFNLPVTLNFDFYQSFYEENINSDTDALSDNMFVLKLNYRHNSLRTNLEFSRIGTDFHTLNGMATRDRKNIVLSIGDRIGNLSYNLSSRYNHDNVNSKRDATNYNYDYSAGLQVLPFQNKNDYIENITLSLDGTMTQTYNRLKNALETTDNDLDILRIRFTLSNRLFNGLYNFNISYEHETEKDNIVNIKTDIKNYEFNNMLRRNITDNLVLDSRAQYRYKDFTDKSDVFLNFAVSMLYNMPNLFFNLGYFLDLNNSSVAGQDSVKHNINFSCDYSKTFAKYSRVISLSSNYLISNFEDSSQDFDRFNIFTSLKFVF